jgi:hypothetical protein
MPLSGDPNLDADCDDAPLRYHTISSILDHPREMADE